MRCAVCGGPIRRMFEHSGPWVHAEPARDWEGNEHKAIPAPEEDRA